MKILHLCNNLWWGSGKAARRLHESLLSIGVSSRMLVYSDQSGTGPGIHVVPQPSGIMQRVKRAMVNRQVASDLQPYLNSRPDHADLFVDDRFIPVHSEHPLVQEADIINLHWVGQSGHRGRFFRALSGKPIVWTLHDMLPFTGGCVYAGDCPKYQDICGSCPQLGSSQDHDLSREIWERKRKAYTRHADSLNLVTPSTWLADCVQKSTLFCNAKTHVILHGLSLETFKPRDRGFSRQLFGIPCDHFVLLAGSIDSTTARKGFSILTDALKLLSAACDTSQLTLITFGSSWKNSSIPAGINTIHLGVISDELLMSCVYSSANATILPSCEDNLPLVMIESIACGTPVVAFKTGGVPDVITSGHNGLITSRPDAVSLSEALVELTANPALTVDMGKAARQFACENLDSFRQAEKYRTLYQTLFQAHSAARG
jgi:glycosyltransferase involved in cell wall biosynthesis